MVDSIQTSPSLSTVKASKVLTALLVGVCVSREASAFPSARYGGANFYRSNRVSHQFRPLQAPSSGVVPRLDDMSLPLFGSLFGGLFRGKDRPNEENKHDVDRQGVETTPLGPDIDRTNHDAGHIIHNELGELYSAAYSKEWDQLGANEHYLTAVNKIGHHFTFLTKSLLQVIARESTDLNDKEVSAIQMAVDLAQCSSGRTDEPLGVLLLTPQTNRTLVDEALKTELGSVFADAVQAKLNDAQHANANELAVDLSQVLEQCLHRFITNTVQGSSLIEWLASFHYAIKIFYQFDQSALKAFDEASRQDDRSEVLDHMRSEAVNMIDQDEPPADVSSVNLETFSWHFILLRLTYEFVYARLKTELPDQIFQTIQKEPEFELSLITAVANAVERSERFCYGKEAFERRLLSTREFGIDTAKNLMADILRHPGDSEKGIVLDNKNSKITVEKGTRARKVKAFIAEKLSDKSSFVDRLVLMRSVPSNWRGRVSRPTDLSIAKCLREEALTFAASLAKQPSIVSNSYIYISFREAINKLVFPPELAPYRKAITTAMESYHDLILKEKITDSVRYSRASPALIHSDSFPQFLNEWIDYYKLCALSTEPVGAGDVVRLAEKYFPEI